MGFDYYIPEAFRSFQGFVVKDIREFRLEHRMEIHLKHAEDGKPHCSRCGCRLGTYKTKHPLTLKHLRMMGWQVEVFLYRHKYWCEECQKDRSEHLSFVCPTSPHLTMELAWWINRLTEITSVLAVSKLESIDKDACYAVDKYILTRLLQGYKIPKIFSIAVDEVYARSREQLKKGENRDDLFFTVIIDAQTRKVIWVSQSRRQAALDEFFELIGPGMCKDIEVVSCDQHEEYSRSVKTYCPQAKIVWDKFHLVQHFNEALDLDRQEELRRLHAEGDISKHFLVKEHKFKFVTKRENRSLKAQTHIDEISKLNEKISKMEIIKEHLYKMFECQTSVQAQVLFDDCIQWATQVNARCILAWLKSVGKDMRFWNYFLYRVTNGVAEGINRVIKGLKWQAYGYKDMQYFILKILQKCGYLNSRYHFQKLR